MQFMATLANLSSGTPIDNNDVEDGGKLFLTTNKLTNRPTLADPGERR